MTSIDCPNCSGTGYTQDEVGTSVVCPVCDGTGTLAEEENTDYIEAEG